MLSKLFSEFQSPDLLQINVHRINSNQEHPKLTDLMYKWHLFDGEIDEKLRKNKSTFPTEGCESKLFIVRRRELGVEMHKCYFAVDIDKLLPFNRTISNATRTNGFPYHCIIFHWISNGAQHWPTQSTDSFDYANNLPSHRRPF